MKGLIVLTLVCSAVAAAAQLNYPYDIVSTVVLPKGDVQAGRKAFQDLKCHVCHQVSGESGFTAPVTELRGPISPRSCNCRRRPRSPPRSSHRRTR